MKPADLSEAERERLKRQYRCAGRALGGRGKPLLQRHSPRGPAWRAQQLTARFYCRGVFWDRKTKRWRCQLGYQSKKIFLGYFDDAGEAARAYDQKLVELRGAGGEWALALQGVCLVGSAASACRWLGPHHLECRCNCCCTCAVVLRPCRHPCWRAPHPSAVWARPCRRRLAHACRHGLGLPAQQRVGPPRLIAASHSDRSSCCPATAACCPPRSACSVAAIHACITQPAPTSRSQST